MVSARLSLTLVLCAAVHGEDAPDFVDVADEEACEMQQTLLQQQMLRSTKNHMATEEEESKEGSRRSRMAQSSTCEVHEHLMCPDGSGRMCSGNQCCPDGSTCPSAEYNHVHGCEKPKTHDCTRGLAASTCSVGDHLKCPGSDRMCSGNQCCPDGSTCPSAEHDHVHGCAAPKTHDCTKGPAFKRGTTEEQFDELHDIAQRFRVASARDFSFKEGLMYNFGLEACNKLTANNMTCFANNPSSPYGLVMVPPPEGREEDEEDLSQCGSLWKPWCEPNAVGEMATFPFHFEAEEAIVVLGITPPEVKYFGFTNYLYDRTFPDDFTIDPSVGNMQRCWQPGDAERRCDIFASMGDALNHGNLQTHHGGGPYAQPFAMVISPSQSTATQVAGQLQEAGLTAVNFLPLPGAALSMGFAEGVDTFGTLLRTAFPTDVDAYQAWLAQMPFIVLRATPRSDASTGTAELYPEPGYCPEGTSVPPPPNTYCLTRRSTAPEAERVGLETERLRAAQMEVVRQLEQTVRLDKNSQTTNFGSTVPDNGFECLRMGFRCQGDSRDTYYPSSVEFIRSGLTTGFVKSQLRELVGLEASTQEELASATVQRSKRVTLTSDYQDTMYVVGVLHSATQASLYSSLSVYDLWKLQGILSVADVDVQGSAMEWLQGTEYEDLAPYLFVAEFTRNRCEGRRFCFNVPSDPSEGAVYIPEDTPLLFIERMYFDETTHVGLAPDAAVTAMIVHTVSDM